MNETTEQISPGLAVYRAMYGPLFSPHHFHGSLAFRCGNYAEAAIAASGLRERVKELEEKIEILNDLVRNAS